MARLVNIRKKIWHGKVLRRRATDKGQSQAFMPTSGGYARFNLSGAPVKRNLRKKHATGWAKKMFFSLPKPIVKQLALISANKHLNYHETLLANKKALKEELVKAQGTSKGLEQSINSAIKTIDNELAGEKTAGQPAQRKP